LNSFHKFDCGCEIPIVDGSPQIDFDKLNYECPKVWELYQKGFTQSVFQLESYIGKKWSAELKPENIIDASNLISIVRPGVANACDENGTSLTRVFCDRKNGKSPIDTSDVLYKFTKNTQNIFIYQEQIMSICKELADFTGKQQSELLKSLGKKQSDKLMGLRKVFIEGSVNKKTLTLEQAEFVFDNIEKSGKYLFNFSHGISYAVVGYQTAWVKAHLPHHYVCAWLRISTHESKPLEEIRTMVSECHRLQIPIQNPSIKNIPETDFFIKNNIVYFGISSIKNCSDKAIQKIIESGIDLENCGWTEFLILYSGLVNKKQLISMIRAGCFDCMGYARMYCEYEFEQWHQITKGQQKRLIDFYKNGQFNKLADLLDSFLKNAKISKTDQNNLPFILNALLSPSIELYDSPSNIIAHEKELLGINISCSKIQRANIPDAKDSCASTTKEANKYKAYVLVGEIIEYKEFKIKKGKLAGQIMSNFKLVDDSGDCDIVAFPEKVDTFQSALYDGNTVLIIGKKSSRGGIILENCYEV
jgi:DNA polymerase-3 subunit alpha